MSTMTLTPSTTSNSVRRAGLWCLGAGLLGAAQAAILLAWPPQVAGDRFSYPFTGFGYALAQISFSLQHLPLVAGVGVLLTLPALRTSRIACIATWTAVVGLVLLAAMELVAVVAHAAATDYSSATLVNNLYGLPVILIGAGLVVAGIALISRGTAGSVGARWLPVLVLVMGVYVFVPLTPAMMGAFVAGRLGIGGWMLLFAGFGYGLTRLKGDHA
ncbi:hypothetical protein BH10ACT10_BH10ACT10_13700 [soil metagenome]